MKFVLMITALLMGQLVCAEGMPLPPEGRLPRPGRQADARGHS